LGYRKSEHTIGSSPSSCAWSILLDDLQKEFFSWSVMFHGKKQYFEFFRHTFFEIENLIILFDRAHRVLLRKQERRWKNLLSESAANFIYLLQTDQYYGIFLCERYRSIECYFFFRTLILDKTFWKNLTHIVTRMRGDRGPWVLNSSWTQGTHRTHRTHRTHGTQRIQGPHEIRRTHSTQGSHGSHRKRETQLSSLRFTSSSYWPSPPYSSSHTYTQIETFTCTNKLSYRTRSTEPSENDMHIQFHHGVKSDTPPILKQHTYHRKAGPSNTHPMKTSPTS
jgi:hypothetical protein